MSKSNTFFTTRPSLASYLMDCGCSGKKCSNPYNSSRPAWTFEGTKDLYNFLKEYEKDKGVITNGSNNPR